MSLEIVDDGVGNRFIPIRRNRLGLSWSLGRSHHKFPAALEKLSWAENLMVGVISNAFYQESSFRKVLSSQ